MAREDPKDDLAKPTHLIVQNHRYARELRTAKRMDEAAALFDEAGAAAREPCHTDSGEIAGIGTSGRRKSSELWRDAA